MTALTPTNDFHFDEEKDCLENVIQAFFSRESIISTVLAIVQQRHEHDDDPFSELMIMMISQPLCVCINECGFAPFRHDPTVVVPFHSMTSAQVRCMQACLGYFNRTRQFVSSVQVGGGLYVASFTRRAAADRRHIDTALVLYACNVILRTCLARDAPADDQDTAARVRNVGNVILQRILAAVLVPEERIARAEEMAREYFAG